MSTTWRTAGRPRARLKYPSRHFFQRASFMRTAGRSAFTPPARCSGGMMVPPRAAPKSVPLSGEVGAARALIDALVPAS